jgi:hypothetical protein
MIIGAAVLLLLFVGWIAFKNLGPRPMGPTGPTEQSKTDWISQLAKQSGGDFNKLDPQTRQKLDIYTGGKGAELIKTKYQSATR